MGQIQEVSLILLVSICLVLIVSAEIVRNIHLSKIRQNKAPLSEDNQNLALVTGIYALSGFSCLGSFLIGLIYGNDGSIVLENSSDIFRAVGFAALALLIFLPLLGWSNAKLRIDALREWKKTKGDDTNSWWKR